jgi:hypothetical protein
MIPRVGDRVHYVSYGTPEGEYTSQCRAAIVTEVPHVDQARTDELRAEGEKLLARGTVGLAVLNPSGILFGEADYDDGSEAEYKGGSWHWREGAAE